MDFKILQEKILCIFNNFTMEVSLPLIINTKEHTKNAFSSKVSVQGRSQICTSVQNCIRGQNCTKILLQKGSLLHKDIFVWAKISLNFFSIILVFFGFFFFNLIFFYYHCYHIPLPSVSNLCFFFSEFFFITFFCVFIFNFVQN